MTPRQAEALCYAARGCRVEKTSAAMRVSVHTAKEYRRGAMRALGARTMTHAVAIAIRTNQLTYKGGR